MVGSDQGSDTSEASTIRPALSGSQDVHEPVPVPSEICGAPTNYLSVRRLAFRRQEGPISGQYLIDLSLPPLPQSMPHVVSGSDNLFLHTTEGSISVSVWVTGKNKLRRASMKLFTDGGGVRADVHNAFSGGERERRPSFDIEVKANHGGVSLSLPHCFRGLITIKCSHEFIHFSPAFNKRTALLSEDNNVCVYFVGDRPRSWMGGENAGRYQEGSLDELSVGGIQVGMQNSVGVWIRCDGDPKPPW